jgi:prolyl-tRNA editing enzyme YbaK/EbsC (Cys-tRNA(Pro) deacylase)
VSRTAEVASRTAIDLVAQRVSQSNGGVPVFGSEKKLRIFIGADLLQYEEVWAAAGTWNDVFGIDLRRLVDASGGVVTDLKRG